MAAKAKHAAIKKKPSHRAESPALVPNVLIVAQAGRLEYQAIVFAASLRHASPNFKARVIVAEPQPEGKWDGHDTQIGNETRDILESLGAEIRPFTAEYFGSDYPHGNKIEALKILPVNEPFIFFDTDTLVTGPLDKVKFDFSRPAASMRREGTWPEPPLYGPGYSEIWKSLYDRFGLDFASTLDKSHPDEHWERYLYFNAGWFFGDDPAEFGDRFMNWALAVRDDPQDELACQSFDPWLDQIILPLVIHSLGGGRPRKELDGLDGSITYHYRNLPLLYAQGPDLAVDTIEQLISNNKIKKRLKEWFPAKKLLIQGKGREKIRPLFDQSALPSKEKAIRNKLKNQNWWLL